MNSIVYHVSVGVNDLARSARFYDAVLAELEIYRQFEIPEVTVAYGKNCEFWIGIPDDDSITASAGNGMHIAFLANSRNAVIKFYETAMSLGGQGCGEPGYRVKYDKNYFAAFVKDPDGNKIESVYRGEIAARYS